MNKYFYSSIYSEIISGKTSIMSDIKEIIAHLEHSKQTAKFVKTFVFEICGITPETGKKTKSGAIEAFAKKYTDDDMPSDEAMEFYNDPVYPDDKQKKSSSPKPKKEKSSSPKPSKKASTAYPVF